MTLRDLPPIPDASGWTQGGLQQPGLEYINELARVIGEYKTAIEALQSAEGPEGPEVYDPAILQSITGYDSTNFTAVSPATQTKAAFEVSFTPVQESSTVIAMCNFGMSTNGNEEVSFHLLFKNTVVQTLKAWINTTTTQNSLIFTHSPNGQSGEYEVAVTTAAATGNILGEGMTSLRIDEIRQD